MWNQDWLVNDFSNVLWVLWGYTWKTKTSIFKNAILGKYYMCDLENSHAKYRYIYIFYDVFNHSVILITEKYGHWKIWGSIIEHILWNKQANLACLSLELVHKLDFWAWSSVHKGGVIWHHFWRFLPYPLEKEIYFTGINWFTLLFK